MNVLILNSNNAQWNSINQLFTLGDLVFIRNSIASYPVDLTDDAKLLMYVAGLDGLDITDPLRTLSDLPSHIMRVLNYTFAIACDDLTYDVLAKKLPPAIRYNLPSGVLMITTATLDVWYGLLTSILTGTWTLSTGEIKILDQILLLLESRGLTHVFKKFRKVKHGTQTFLLESV
jgi:hypothetical protein